MGSIGVMLERDPRVPARVVLERLRREGYDGGITILKDYLAQVRPPTREPRVYQRTSYLPGEIAQCDWWQLPISAPVGGGTTRKVYGLVTTLPHSAALAGGVLPVPRRQLTSAKRSSEHSDVSVVLPRR